jgi:hypothetical protein
MLECILLVPVFHKSEVDPTLCRPWLTEIIVKERPEPNAISDNVCATIFRWRAPLNDVVYRAVA